MLFVAGNKIMHSYASASGTGGWNGFAILNILIGVESFGSIGSFSVLADLSTFKVCQKPRAFSAFTGLAMQEGFDGLPGPCGSGVT